MNWDLSTDPLQDLGAALNNTTDPDNGMLLDLDGKEYFGEV